MTSVLLATLHAASVGTLARLAYHPDRMNS
jgi:hypothetical protein